MSEETQQSTPKIIYAAHLLKRLTDASAVDPLPSDISRLSSPLLDVVMSVYSEGRDNERRKARLKDELTARELDTLLLSEIERADPKADLLSLQTVSQWEAFDLADVMNETIPPIEWVVKYFVPKPSVVVFFGKAKHKKTLIALDMAISIAAGLPWMTSPGGRDGIEVNQARCVWVDLENGEQLMKRRMKAFAHALSVNIPHGQFLTYSMPSPWLDLSKPENIPAMIERIKALGDIGVVIVDHLLQVFGMYDENSSLASQIMGALRQISQATNTAIILIHHSKKGTGKDSGAPEDMLRGSGAILAGVDAAFLVERDIADKNQVTVKPVAVRGPDAPNIAANFTYEQDDNLDLTTARFWRIAYRSIAARAHDAVLQALKENDKLNHTELRAEAANIDSGLSDAKIREAIATLEGKGEIFFVMGAKGAKIYELKESGDDDE
jgi:hypothetical protein